MYQLRHYLKKRHMLSFDLAVSDVMFIRGKINEVAHSLDK